MCGICPDTARRSPLTWLVVVGLLVVFVAVVYGVLRAGSEAGQGMPPFSVYSDDRNGLAQSAALLRKLGFQPVAVTRPIHHTHHRGLLFVVEPRLATNLMGQPTDVSEATVNGMLGWVAKGNTLVLLSRRETSLHRALHVHMRRAENDVAEDGQAVHKIELSGYTDEIDQLEVESLATVEPRAAHLPLWWLGNRPGAVFVRHGQGRVLVVADPSLLTHRGLLRRDNVMFLCNVAARDVQPMQDARGRLVYPVYFDEYHHGIRSGGGYWSYLRFHGQHWALLHLLVLAGTVVWGLAVRLGPAIPTATTRRADAVDYASAVARIYQQAGMRHRLAGQIVRDFLDLVTAHLQLKRTTGAAQIVAAWRKRYSAETVPLLQDLLRGTTELRQASGGAQDVSERVLLTWARAFDLFVADMRARKLPLAA